jgi:hypothetical protein
MTKAVIIAARGGGGHCLDTPTRTALMSGAGLGALSVAAAADAGPLAVHFLASKGAMKGG